MNDHTQGPWEWRVEDYSMANLLGPKEEFDHVLSVSPCKSCQEHARGGEWEWGRCTTPTEANARLIAAAPELLEVLKAYVAWEVEYMTINNLGDPEKQHNVKWARAVIAKATTPLHASAESTGN